MTRIKEDRWHSLAGKKAAEFVTRSIQAAPHKNGRLLNAGCGQYDIHAEGWSTICLDLFDTPLRGRELVLCGNVEALPFQPTAFQAVVCVGEVLGYCDPARTIGELSRVLSADGLLVIDFTSSRSIRRWGTKAFARAAEMIIDEYNGSPETSWIYDPRYVKSILQGFGMTITSETAIHSWSALGRKIGLSSHHASRLEELLQRFPFPKEWGDLTMIAAVRRKIAL